MGLGGLVSGSLATTALSTKTKAVSIDNSHFDIPDTSKTVNDPVQNARITATGSFRIESNTPVSRVVLRLEATTTDTYTQIAAKSYNPNEKDVSIDFELTGSIIDLETVGQDDINPIDRGTSKSIDLTTKLSLTAYSDGEKVGSDSTKDGFTLTISKAEKQATMSLDATGNVTVVT